MIEVKDLRKAYLLSKQQLKEMDIPPADIKVEAVKGITFTCHPGRIYSLLGPNGAGKTTTLRMIATILKPTAGQIMVNGHNVVNAPTAVRANIGFLTGSTKLYERLTPDELIAYFAGFYDISPSEFESRKQKLYDLLDIHPFAKKRIGRLSTGMKQKVSIARTMIHDPQVVIFDEPTSGLDVITAQAIIQLVRDCKAQGKTVIFSTHIMGEVELLCDDLGIIHQGQMLYNGTLTDFMQSNEGIPLVEAFINVVANAA